MDATALSASINSLVILSGATLTISSYLHNNFRTRFASGKIELSAAFKKLTDHAGKSIEEENREEYDKLLGSDVDRVKKWLYGIFCIVCMCAILTALNFVANFWLAPAYATSVEKVIEFALTCSGIATAILVPGVGMSLIRVANCARALEKAVTNFEKLDRVAVSAANHG